MKLIVGLGNPGFQYENTRHNVGFMVIDEIAKKMNLNINQKKFDSLLFVNSDFILLKPLTFMNLSGKAVKSVVDFFKIDISDIIIVCDDLDIKLGQAKIKISNSSAGHNGIKSIIEKLETSNFYRLKIGIGRPENKETKLSSYVLGKFNSTEKKVIDKVIDKSAEAIISIIYNDINYVVNLFNQKGKDEWN
ncbi:MAG: aminoacyl-tRNA hydrolase [Mycoplasmataceae bacterium]|nr:aminoacyl-tRNA hydrolase [Mycoplasmataceae bacterium]MBR2055881.1 aminoacyl-tRNA hydrolase [Mycoplasmataceae bacterium]MBR2849005.1 aminoacyl-tRNA hydrolase [Mycoplasmataceae bacterium]MBR3348362.1 aminoacyl-tRNA hydrolase [Mycoplasmataceae bacterium]MBR3571417.1 aminoacyl-tRNA hydrolase [Mycoplasmataceae bacterium]